MGEHDEDFSLSQGFACRAAVNLKDEKTWREIRISSDLLHIKLVFKAVLNS